MVDHLKFFNVFQILLWKENCKFLNLKTLILFVIQSEYFFFFLENFLHQIFPSIKSYTFFIMYSFSNYTKPVFKQIINSVRINNFSLIALWKCGPGHVYNI